jgi:hypothetical protein
MFGGFPQIDSNGKLTVMVKVVDDGARRRPHLRLSGGLRVHCKPVEHCRVR